MNGSKSTFKRKGYWLTAFAAAVLLAASPGTASSAGRNHGDSDEVTEGETATYHRDQVEGHLFQPDDNAQRQRRYRRPWQREFNPDTVLVGYRSDARAV